MPKKKTPRISGRLLTCALSAALLLQTMWGTWAPPVYAAVLSQTDPGLQLSLNDRRSGALRSDGSLWTWGDNSSYGLGTGDNVRHYRPAKIMEGIQSSNLGEQSGAAIKADGSLWVWGFNENGKLAAKMDKIYLPHPTKILDNVRQVCLGSSHSGAVKTDGSLWMWGDNTYGALGNGLEWDVDHKPTKVLTNVKKISLGLSNTAALKNDGTLWVWGSNDGGELAIGSTEGNSGDDNLLRPTKIMDDIQDVAFGDAHYSVIKNDGSLWTWGRNDSGQLGTGDTTDHFIPTKIMDNVQSVSLGYEHSMALKNDGTLWTWGGNSWGQLGTGSKTDRLRPVKIMDNVRTADFGSHHGGAVKGDGSLWMWGSNSRGQLGTGDKADHLRPVKVPLPGALPGDDRPNTKPGMPQIEKLTNTASGITIKWGRVAKASGYHLYRKKEDGKWKKIAQIKNGATSSYSDKTIKTQNGTTYSYTLSAYNGKATSPYDKTGRTIMRLTAPTLTKAVSKAPRKAQVTWKKNPKASYYQIQYTAAKDFSNAKSIETGPGNTSKVLTKLAKGRTYRIRIRCYKTSEGLTHYGTWSNVKSVKVLS